MAKKVMKRREAIVKDKDLERITAKMGKVHFSVACWNLSEYSKSSGPGDDLASIAQVYYESKDERKVLNAFSSAGIDLESADANPVDPQSSERHEQRIMYTKEPLYLEDVYEYEERENPLTADEIKKRFENY